MVQRIKNSWHTFRQSEPGQRFQDRYRRRQELTQGRWNWRALLSVVLGLAVIVVGLFLVPAPGPGWLITFVGLGLMASEFAPLAQALDWAELRGRAVQLWAERWWRDASSAQRALVVLLALAVAAALAWLLYLLLFAS